MPTRRPSTSNKDRLRAEWIMLALGFVLSIAGVALWLSSASLEWQIAGIVLLIWGLSAGLRALAGFMRLQRQGKYKNHR